MFRSVADDFQSTLSAPLAGGIDAYLAGEYEDDFFDLHIVKHDDSQVRRCAPVLLCNFFFPPICLKSRSKGLS